MDNSLYIEITNKCNMYCKHCGANCTMLGENMSFKTFKNCVDRLHYDEVILGGGEPMLHPQFRKMVRYLILKGISIFVITNGSYASNLKWLLKETNKIQDYREQLDNYTFNIDVRMSDPYDGLHNPKLVDKKMYELFKSTFRIWLDDTYAIVAEGRAAKKRNKDWIHNNTKHIVISKHRQECFCEGTIILPNGDIKLCGCKKSPIVGNINNEKIPQKHMMYNKDCYIDYLKSRN